MGRNLFFSYSRADAEIVAGLVRDAAGLGHETWVDTELTGGRRWWDEILRQVRASEVFVACLSPAFLSSSACEAEYGYAVALGKPVLPVLVEPGIADSLLPPGLSEVQRVDYTAADRDAVVALVRALGSVPPAPDLPEVLPEPPPVPATYLFDLRSEIATASELDVTKQRQILDQISEQHVAGHDPVALRQLLRDLRDRDDLLVQTADRITELEALIPAVTAVSGGPGGADAGRSRSPAQPIAMPESPPAAPFQNLAATIDGRAGDDDTVNAMWWLAPVFFGIIGGCIAWLANRDADSATARNMLIAGVISSFVWLILAGG